MKQKKLLLLAGIIGIIILCIGYFIFFIGGRINDSKPKEYYLSESANIVITDGGFSQDDIMLMYPEITPSLIKVSNGSSQSAEIEVTQPNRKTPLISLTIPPNEQSQFVVEVFGSFIIAQKNTNSILKLDIVQE